MNRKNKSEYIVADVTEEEYRKELARGLSLTKCFCRGVISSGGAVS